MNLNVEEAYKNLKEEVFLTKVFYSKEISEKTKSEVYFKLENQQLTGSFKIRGALNKLKVLLKEKSNIKKLVAASTGNHAAAVAYAAWKHGVDVIIFAPKSISAAKLANLRKQNIDLRLYGIQSVETELYAKKFAEENSLPFIHPYNDNTVISGQGTIAVELLEQVDNFDAVFIPIGGGGLISGIASYIKAVKPEIKVIGCQPENAAEMHDSLKSGEIVGASNLPTIADRTAGGLDPETITFELCKKNVDEVVLVSEKEIAEAVYLIYKYHEIKVEPAAALSVASILKHSHRLKTNRNIAILSGSKITDERLIGIIEKFEKQDGVSGFNRTPS